MTCTVKGKDKVNTDLRSASCDLRAAICELINHPETD